MVPVTIAAAAVPANLENFEEIVKEVTTAVMKNVKVDALVTRPVVKKRNRDEAAEAALNASPDSSAVRPSRLGHVTVINEGAEEREREREREREHKERLLEKARSIKLTVPETRGSVWDSLPELSLNAERERDMLLFREHPQGAAEEDDEDEPEFEIVMPPEVHKAVPGPSGGAGKRAGAGSRGPRRSNDKS